MVAHKHRLLSDADVVMSDLRFPTNDPFRLTLSDSDERLIGPSAARPCRRSPGLRPVRSRSMERIEMMFGGYGSEPQAWHYYTPLLNAGDVENNDLVAINCREGALFPRTRELSRLPAPATE